MRTSRPPTVSSSGASSLATAHKVTARIARGSLSVDELWRYTCKAVADTKQDVLDMLRDLAELSMLEEGNPQSFRVRAYQSAAQAIAAQATDLGKLTAPELQQIQGIGKSTADKIRLLLETGKVEKLEKLRQKHPRSVRAMLRIHGLGPKAIVKLRRELGVESIDDLRSALAQHKVQRLSGFAAKSEQRLSEALARFDAQGSVDRTPIHVAHRLATRVINELAEVPGVSHASYCGSLRRLCETVGDIDLVVVAEDPHAVMEAFVSLRSVEAVLVRGVTKTSVLTHRGTQIDLRVVEADQLGAAMLYFTGSKGHNIKLRQRAQARGMTLNEYSLSTQGGKAVASRTEEEIYAALDLPWIPPVLREDTGEIEGGRPGCIARAHRQRRRRLPCAYDAFRRWSFLARRNAAGRQGARPSRAGDN